MTLAETIGWIMCAIAVLGALFVFAVVLGRDLSRDECDCDVCRRLKGDQS